MISRGQRGAPEKDQKMKDQAMHPRMIERRNDVARAKMREQWRARADRHGFEWLCETYIAMERGEIKNFNAASEFHRGEIGDAIGDVVCEIDPLRAEEIEDMLCNEVGR